MSIRSWLTLLTLSLAWTLASATGFQPFSQQTFDKLSRAGKPVVLEIGAGWCPICKVQRPILEGLLQQPAYRGVTLMTIDFDTQKALMKKFNAPVQGTLLGFKGSREVARSIGDTTPDGIEGLFKKTVQ
jgi:thiol-disulfide isomerase/thioredoxin